MCSDEEFSDESSGSEEFNQGLYRMCWIDIIRRTQFMLYEHFCYIFSHDVIYTKNVFLILESL
jgi:hypothetical protein